MPKESGKKKETKKKKQNPYGLADEDMAEFEAAVEESNLEGKKFRRDHFMKKYGKFYSAAPAQEPADFYEIRRRLDENKKANQAKRAAEAKSNPKAVRAISHKTPKRKSTSPDRGWESRWGASDPGEIQHPPDDPRLKSTTGDPEWESRWGASYPGELSHPSSRALAMRKKLMEAKKVPDVPRSTPAISKPVVRPHRNNSVTITPTSRSRRLVITVKRT